MIVDTHCHLDYLEEPLETVIAMAKEMSVTRFMTIAVEEKHWGALCKMGEHPNIDVALGIHPCDVVKAKEGWQERLLQAAKREPVVAIGETGLDNYHNADQEKAQIEALEDHAFIAKKLNKPLVLHMRDAKDSLLSFITKNYSGRGILHCYTEDLETAKRAIDHGFLISFSGIVTFKNAVQVQEVAKQLPLTSILLETDAPYLAPVPYRGKTNFPAYTRFVAEKIAELRGVSWEEVARQTYQNYEELIKTN